MKSLPAAILLASLFAAASAFADPPPNNPANHALSWSPITGIDHQIFPSAQISMAMCKARIPFLRVKVLNARAGSKIQVTVKCAALMDDTTEEFTAPKDTPTLLFPIMINWKYDRLGQVKQLTPVDFVYAVSIDGKDMGEKTESAYVHSVNDCLLEYRNDDGSLQPLRFLFAAYVNEDHPKIAEVKKDALAMGVVPEFIGYPTKSPNLPPQQAHLLVYRQVYAIWESLQLKGIRYTDAVNAPDRMNSVLSQPVKFLDESLDGNQVTCIDGSLLFASALQNIGIDSALVILPNHMFVLFYLEPGFHHPVTLETTLLGNPDLVGDVHEDMSDVLDPKWKSDASAKTFEAATRADMQKYNNLVTALQQQAADHSDRFVGNIVNISAARKIGIMPISYDLTAN